MYRIVVFIAFSFAVWKGTAQDVIQLKNPSFEDFARNGHAPRYWYDCGFEGETPPDTHPMSMGGEFNVATPPALGQTYLGMVVRDNETWEAVAQRLSSPLKQGECYDFSLYLARSSVYESLSRITNDPANYDKPSIIRIWGCILCEKRTSWND